MTREREADVERDRDTGLRSGISIFCSRRVVMLLLFLLSIVLWRSCEMQRLSLIDERSVSRERWKRKRGCCFCGSYMSLWCSSGMWMSIISLETLERWLWGKKTSVKTLGFWFQNSFWIWFHIFEFLWKWVKRKRRSQREFVCSVEYDLSHHHHHHH